MDPDLFLVRSLLLHPRLQLRHPGLQVSGLARQERCAGGAEVLQEQQVVLGPALVGDPAEEQQAAAEGGARMEAPAALEERPGWPRSERGKVQNVDVLQDDGAVKTAADHQVVPVDLHHCVLPPWPWKVALKANPGPPQGLQVESVAVIYVPGAIKAAKDDHL